MAIIFNIILVTATCQMTGQHVAADVPTRPAHVLGQVGQRVVLGQAGVKCAGQGPQGKQAKHAEGPQVKPNPRKAHSLTKRLSFKRVEKGLEPRTPCAK